MRDIIEKNSVQKIEKNQHKWKRSRENRYKKSAGGQKRNYLIQNWIITEFLQKNEPLTRARAI